MSHRYRQDRINLLSYRSSISTLPIGRLLCGQRACLLRTLDSTCIISQILRFVNNKFENVYNYLLFMRLQQFRNIRIQGDGDLAQFQKRDLYVFTAAVQPCVNRLLFRAGYFN